VVPPCPNHENQWSHTIPVKNGRAPFPLAARLPFRPPLYSRTNPPPLGPQLSGPRPSPICPPVPTPFWPPGGGPPSPPRQDGSSGPLYQFCFWRPAQSVPGPHALEPISRCAVNNAHRHRREVKREAHRTRRNYRVGIRGTMSWQPATADSRTSSPPGGGPGERLATPAPNQGRLHQDQVNNTPPVESE